MSTIISEPNATPPSPAPMPQNGTPVQQEVAHDSRTETPLESLASICTVLAVGLFVMAFIFQNFEIPSGSMEQTLLIGDHVLVDRTTLAPASTFAKFIHYRDVRRGDVIVFYKPNSETPDMFLVKRAIGLPGDRIHLRNGVLFLNGVAQKEPQAGKPADDGDPLHAFNAYRDDFPAVSPGEGTTALWAEEMPRNVHGEDLVVPPGKVFAMGDNRTESLDSRYWGFVPRENIVGRPLFVYWSFKTPANQISKQSIGERISFMGHVLLHVFDGTRWSRTLHLIH